MNYRSDLITWRMEQLGITYRDISSRGLSTGLLSKLCKGTSNPTSKTLAKVANRLGLHRKYLLDSDLKKRDFHRAVIGNGQSVRRRAARGASRP